MKAILILTISVALLLPAAASTKTLTILGDKKIKTQWDGNMPKAMSDQGIETNVTGIIIFEGKLVPTFGFDISSPKKLQRVVVEDVTGNAAISLVEDSAPTIARGHWKGNGSGRDITPAGVPWLFASGDTLTVFRFTVYLEGAAQPIVIYQPSVFRESSKVQLRSIAALINKSK